MENSINTNQGDYNNDKYISFDIPDKFVTVYAQNESDSAQVTAQTENATKVLLCKLSQQRQKPIVHI